jgi:hypothetical protein
MNTCARPFPVPSMRTFRVRFRISGAKARSVDDVAVRVVVSERVVERHAVARDRHDPRDVEVAVVGFARAEVGAIATSSPGSHPSGVASRSIVVAPPASRRRP